MRKPNKKLLRKTLAAIVIADEKKWKQENWRCKTGMCFAGWAATLDGWKLVIPPGARANRIWNQIRTDTVSDADEASFFEVKKGRRVLPIADAAIESLKISQRAADNLFEGDNTLEDIARVIEEIESGGDAA